MKKRDLVKALEKYPDDIEIWMQGNNDWDDEFTPINGIKASQAYKHRYHPNQPEGDWGGTCPAVRDKITASKMVLEIY